MVLRSSGIKGNLKRNEEESDCVCDGCSATAHCGAVKAFKSVHPAFKRFLVGRNAGFEVTFNSGKRDSLFPPGLLPG